MSAQPHPTPNNAVINDLRQSLAWMELVLANLQEGVLVIGKDRHIVYANTAAANLLGKPRILLLGSYPWKLMHIFIPGQETQNKYQPPTFKQISSLNGIYEIKIGDTQRVVEMSSASLAHLDQTILVIRDITERESQENLRQAYLASIIESSQDAIFTISLDGTITSWNEGAEKTYGYSAKEIISKPLSLLAPPERLEEQDEILKKIQAGIPIKQRELVRQHKDGSLIDLSVSVSPLTDPRGRLIGSAIISRDITDKKRSEEKIRHQLYHDPLTGLPNRLLLYERFTQHLGEAAEKSSMLGVMFLDLDNFKKINDSLGHAAGDLLLQEIGKRLKKSLRREDTVARFAGDEFVVLLPDIQDPAIIHRIAQKILAAVAQDIQVEKATLQVQASIGISVYPHHGSDPDTLIKRADKALYKVKRDGKNSYHLSSSVRAKKRG